MLIESIWQTGGFEKHMLRKNRATAEPREQPSIHLKASHRRCLTSRPLERLDHSAVFEFTRNR